MNFKENDIFLETTTKINKFKILCSSVQLCSNQETHERNEDLSNTSVPKIAVPLK